MKRTLLSFFCFFLFLASAPLAAGGAVEAAQNPSQTDTLPLENLFIAWLEGAGTPVAAVPLQEEGWLIASVAERPRMDQYGVLVRIDSEGRREWTKEYGGDNLVMHSLLPLRDGKYLLAGTNSPTDRERWEQRSSPPLELAFEDPETGEEQRFTVAPRTSHFWIRKIDANGEDDPEWSGAIFSTNDDESLTSAVECADGDILLAAASYAQQEYRLRLVRTDPQGKVLRDRLFDTERIHCDAVLENSEGNFLLGGTVDSIFRDRSRISLAKTDSAGNVVWNRVYDERRASLTALLQANDGTYAIIGEEYDENLDSRGLLKIVDASGSELLAKKLDIENANDAALLPGGEIAVCGDEVVAGFDMRGELLWRVVPAGLEAVRFTRIFPVGARHLLLLGTGNSLQEGRAGKTGGAFAALLVR